MTATPSRFIWYELLTSDPDAAERFYTSVIGWSAKSAGQEGKDYRLWQQGHIPVGGLMPIPPDAAAAGLRPCWMGYLDVPDLEASIAQIIEAGGSLHMPPLEIPGVGRIAALGDPQGAAIYIMTPLAEGQSQAYGPDTGHIGWNELHADDLDAAFAFYAKTFGWQKDRAIDMGPMGIYQIFGTGDMMLGGMMKAPADTRPHWHFYINVEAATPAIARIEQAGGSVLMQPQQVPGGSWIVQGRDPQGAAFAVVAPRLDQ